MRLLELSALYLVVGAGCAAVVALRPGPWARRGADAALLLLFWPLYGPVLLSRLGDEPAPGQEAAFLAALDAARATPLASLLPDRDAVQALAARLRVAEAKVTEIDQLLTRPDFDEHLALRRQRELSASGASGYASSVAGIRVQNIRRLRRMRDRYALELDEVHELLRQLRTQAEVVRLVGAADGDGAELVRELFVRVESLDSMLEADLETAEEVAR